MRTETKIAKDLLSIGAVFLRPGEPFTWASGIRSPIYCDNRIILSHPAVRREGEAALAALVRESYPGCGLLAGTSTAGIAHAAYVSEILGLPMCYVRGAAKDHGRRNRIVGRAEPGARVVVIEDLISTGGSVLEVVDALRQAGCEVLGIASIFTYGLQKGAKRLADAGVRSVSLSCYDALLAAAVEEGVIAREDVPRLERFRRNPQDEGWMAL